MQCVAVCCSVLQRFAVCCSALQCVAVCCSVLQRVAVCCRAFCDNKVRCNLVCHYKNICNRPTYTRQPYQSNNLPTSSTALTTVLLCGAIAFVMVEIYTTYRPTTLHALLILPTLQTTCRLTLKTLNPYYCAEGSRLLF